MPCHSYHASAFARIHSRWHFRSERDHDCIREIRRQKLFHGRQLFWERRTRVVIDLGNGLVSFILWVNICIGYRTRVFNGRYTGDNEPSFSDTWPCMSRRPLPVPRAARTCFKKKTRYMACGLMRVVIACKDWMGVRVKAPVSSHAKLIALMIKRHRQTRYYLRD